MKEYYLDICQLFFYKQRKRNEAKDSKHEESHCQEYICGKSAESKSPRDDSSRMIKGGGVRIPPPPWKEDVTQQKGKHNKHGGNGKTPGKITWPS